MREVLTVPYHGRDELLEEYFLRERTHPSLISHEVFGRTTLGHDMCVFGIGNPTGTRIMIDACIHGDERVAAEVLLLYVDWLVNQREPVAAFILESCRTLVVPIINIDGFTDSGKTQGRRKNVNNVDLYRNFSHRWVLRPNNPARYNYPGPCPESEVETRNMMALYAKTTPELSISMHTGKPPIYVKQISRCGNASAEDDAYMRDMYAKYAQLARKRDQPVHRIHRGGWSGGNPGTTCYRYFHTLSFIIETIDTYPNPPPHPDKFPTILSEWLPLFITFSKEAGRHADTQPRASRA